MDTFFDLLGLVYAVAGVGLAWILWRRPLTERERPLAAVVVIVVATAALAYRLGNLEPA